MSALVKVEIELDRTRVISFSMNEIIELEEALGVTDLVQFDDALVKALGTSFKWTRKVLWMGLRADDPDLTEEQTGTLVSPSVFGVVRDKLMQALSPQRAEPDKTAAPGSAAPPTVAGRRKL